MLRINHSSNTLPASFPCDPSVEFMPGMIAGLKIIGGNIVATVSNGTAPIGIIDDVRTRAFSDVSWNEEVLCPAQGVIGPGGQLVTPIDLYVNLEHPNIIKNSFDTTVDCILNANNGGVTFPAGTPLNIDLLGTGEPNGIRAFVNYTYYVPNIPGDDSTQGSGRITIWYSRMFFQTDQYETNQPYPLNANLFVNECGKLTTRQPAEYFPAVALLTAPPTTYNSFIEVLWL